ncbi:TonB-dependent receptor [Algibacillus agarilyticus]|uniref:TonB-dependent receptor n=1 Tax=Algibacillus agarilyticus TaxID=2234133 RepID=UPI000DD0D659|nr:TonB-dependent receptor [Algibacillus agarilyticus]
MAFQHKKFNKNLLAASILTCLTAPSYMAYSAEAELAQEDDVEVIQVRGIRGSMVASMNNKRFAGNVVDSITATDIGKLPDATIADSLQRITGIQISRSGGEGANVNIRGVSQVGQTLNGEQMLSAGSITTVQPNFADIPSTMVSGIDVAKSAQATNLVAGLSGTIDLITQRPFKLDEGLTLLGKVEGTKGSMGSETDKSMSAFIGYNNDNRFGATLNVSHANVNLADYMTGSTGDDWGFNASEEGAFVQPNLDVTGDNDANDIIYAFQGHQSANQFIERERTGINGSLQFQISEQLQLTADVFYTNLDEYKYVASFIASNSWKNAGWFTPAEGGITEHEHIQKVPVVGEDGVERTEYQPVAGGYYSFSEGTLQSRRNMVHSETHAIEKEALNTNLELAYDNGDNFTAKIRWVHGEANNTQDISVADSYINDGSQAGASYKGVGGEFISWSNPWGYAGQDPFTPDGTTITEDGHTQIPLGIKYTSDNLAWSLPTMTVDGTTEVFGSNINRYAATSTNLSGKSQHGELDVLRLDMNYALDHDMITSVDFGARLGNRKVTQNSWMGGLARTNQYGDAFLARWQDPNTTAPLTGESYVKPLSFVELAEQNSNNITQIDDFQGSSGLGSLYFVNPKAMQDPIAWHNDVYGPHVLLQDGANSYELEEKTSTLYFQANFEGEIGLPFTGNVGLRYIKTDFDILQSNVLSVVPSTPEEIGTTVEFNGVDYQIPGNLGLQPPAESTQLVNNSYNDLLPALNIAFELSDEQKLRFAANKTLTTHDSDNLAGGLSVTRILACDVKDANNADVFCAVEGTKKGNPELKPWRSTNIDVSYEWYFSDTGLLNVGLFYMDIESFTTSSTTMESIADSDGVVRGYDASISDFRASGLTPIKSIGNGEGGSIKGFELGLQTELDVIGLDGFGIATNMTYSPSTSGQVDYYGEDTPLSDNSEFQSNFALWYEKDGIQARIAHNYRSEKFRGIRTIGAYDLAKYQAPTNYIDASVNYDVTENVTLSLQGTNLTEESQDQYYQWEDMIEKRFYNERRVTLGVQVKL